MLDDKFVAHCPKCGIAGSLTKEWKIPIREEDELGRKGRIIGFTVYPSGCLCGEFYTVKVEEKESYKLNLTPSWRKLVKK